MNNINGQVLANERAWEQNGKIERSHIAIGAVVFCIVIAVGVVGLFFFLYFFFEKMGNLKCAYVAVGAVVLFGVTTSGRCWCFRSLGKANANMHILYIW